MQDPETIPDLLSSRPSWRIDFESTDLSVVLAFAGGASGGVFADALARAKPVASNWQPAGFAEDLFLSRFVATCFAVRIGRNEHPPVSQYLARVLAFPPTAVEDVLYRREISHELLATPMIRHQAEQLYASINRLRALLENSSGAAQLDASRRQLDLLDLFRETIELMTGFGLARSGLSRLAAFAQLTKGTEGYRSMLDLLRFDEELANVSFRVGIGADGRVKKLELLSVEENSSNPFVNSPWRRWMSKLELFARGFRFGDGEVMARLLDAVFEGVRSFWPALVQVCGDLEFYLGALGFHDRAKAAGLVMCLPEFVPVAAPRVLKGLFNPLLLGHGITPVPCDLELDRHDTTLLVTGPNSGGKTRLLQSLGLTQLLAQSGLFIPAKEGRLALASGLVVSLIQETQPDQTEGRLGTELVRIRKLFESLRPGAMVILDELCSGTNPSEGEEIFELVVRMLTQLHPQAFITTHFLGFAARLEHEQQIVDLRFCQVVLGPDQEATYQFAPGVAKTSLAAHAAARLGVTSAQLSALIEQNVRRAQVSTEPT
ncbi:MAG: hypothetical protein RJA70_2566 [Pseudomonadota bacterium]|jgi:DNA mismatch repair protein MutS2